MKHLTATMDRAEAEYRLRPEYLTGLGRDTDGIASRRPIARLRPCTRKASTTKEYSIRYQCKADRGGCIPHHTTRPTIYVRTRTILHRVCTGPGQRRRKASEVPVAFDAKPQASNLVSRCPVELPFHVLRTCAPARGGGRLGNIGAADRYSRYPCDLDVP